MPAIWCKTPTAFERDAAAQPALFDALPERAIAYGSQGHEAQRPVIVERLRKLARSEAQQLAALQLHWGLLVNLGRPVPDTEMHAARGRAQAVGQPALAWELARSLGWYWAMNNRAEDGLALLAEHQDWVESNPGNLATRASYRLARSSIYAFGDRLAEAIAEGRLALAASSAAHDWPNALPAMSNLGVMHYWRGEYAAAHEVLASARAQRERLYGGGGAGIKIDIHLGGVLYELDRFDEARSLLEGALEQLRGMPPSEYIRTDALLIENHLAQMAIAGGQPEAAAAALASDTAGLAERFVGRRLALRLRWQRSFADQVDAALVTELQALVARLASPFNRAPMALELARLPPPDQALAQLHPPPRQPRGVGQAWLATARGGDGRRRCRPRRAA